MHSDTLVPSLLASGGSGQGYAELALVVVVGVVGVALLVVGGVVARRGSGSPRWWFALGVAVLIVGALIVALV